MNVQAVIYANDHLNELRRDAAKRREFSDSSKPSLRQRLVSLAGDVRSAFAGQADPTSVIPSAN